MERLEADVFSSESNYAIIRMPGRNFPGCVIQGDSLATLVQDAAKALEFAKARNGNAISLIESVHSALRRRLAHYQKACAEQGMEFPLWMNNALGQ